jgi:hypothetical protein
MKKPVIITTMAVALLVVKRDLGLLLKSVSRSKLRFPPLKRAPVETDRTSANVYMEKKSGIGLILRWM